MAVRDEYDERRLRAYLCDPSSVEVDTVLGGGVDSSGISPTPRYFWYELFWYIV
jgi:hypothetical protein